MVIKLLQQTKEVQTIQRIAMAYHRAPEWKPSNKSIEVYKQASKKTSKLLGSILGTYAVSVDYDPYKDYEDMKAKVHASKGRLEIFSGGNEHPLWDAYDNQSMRYSHDLVHLYLDADFSLAGEARVWRYTASELKHQARGNRELEAEMVALSFSEIIGQACYFLNFGNFPEPQKVALIPPTYQTLLLTTTQYSL